MDVNEILTMDPNSECKIHYEGTEDWKNCYYQYQNKSSDDIDLNKLPILDDKYLNDTGEPLYNDKGEPVYDPAQKIEYETYLGIGFKQIYSSKTFISLLQQAIEGLIDSGELSDESGEDEVLEALGGYHGRGCVDSLAYSLKCTDLECIKDSEDEDVLWFTSSQLDEEGGEIYIEEI